ncbi:MAG TPA: ATP-binding cassette domain-containing protein [Tenericutes bacterium]|nr:ATP-binding cassette domain-containing protein [Mycoplasmatota bacterium]
MRDIISIKNLSFKYDKTSIFDKFNLNIKRGSVTTILGANGSGKTTLLKLILGIYEFDGEIYIDNILLSKKTKKDIRKKIGVVFDKPENSFVSDIVIDDIVFSLENLNYSKEEIEDRINEISKLLNIDKLLYKRVNELSGGEKQLVAIASALSHNPEILIFDEAFSMLDLYTKEKIFEVIKDLHKKTNITIINITHSSNDCLYGDTIIVLDEGRLILKGDTKRVLEEEKMFEKLGLELPFMASLSIKLKYYGLVDEIILDMDEMVNKLWK